MIYEFFKRRYALPRARDTAAQAHMNREKKLRAIMSEIARRVMEAAERGDRQTSHHLEGRDMFLREELVDRLRAEGYLVSHEPIEDGELDPPSLWLEIMWPSPTARGRR